MRVEMRVISVPAIRKKRFFAKVYVKILYIAT
jgi:hypothetical protein